MTNAHPVQPDRNSLGKAAFIIGLIGLIFSFIPIIGFVAWLLAPLAIIFGLIALFRPSRSLAIAGIVCGGLALVMCFSWIKVTQQVGQAMNKDTFDTKGDNADLSNAPIIDASIKQVWKDIEDNKIAAGAKYGHHRLRFTNEKIEDFGGTAASPEIDVVGKREAFLLDLVSVSFSESDGKKLTALKKGGRVSFVCQSVMESIGGGYSLDKCTLQ